MTALKEIITTHQNPLLDDFSSLQTTVIPDEYAGFIYMWKCIPEDCYYIGSHLGIPKDEYRGSGRRFKQVFEHYGMTQFERVILEYVVDRADIKNVEQFWLNKFKAVMSVKFYNQKNAVKQ